MKKIPQDKTDYLAEQITRRLFINGFGQLAKRLKLECEKELDCGGLCFDAAKNKIKEEMERSPVFEVARRRSDDDRLAECPLCGSLEHERRTPLPTAT